MTVAGIWLTSVAVGVYVFFFQPGSSGFFPGCPFRAFTGIICPGCGSTRGLHHLLHGDLETALQLNPLMVLLLPFLIFALLRHTNAVLRGKQLKGNQLPANAIWALFFVIVAFWVARNIPGYPFPV